MIFKLKPSKKTQEIFEEIGKSTALKPYTLVKHAIAWSLKEQGKITSFDSDISTPFFLCLVKGQHCRFIFSPQLEHII